MPHPILTVVVPVKDRSTIIKTTLESIAAQTARPLKVVLVDNASSDSTLQVLNSWQTEVQAPDFEVTVAEEPLPGAAAARNRGLSLADTEWTLFFDSDDVMLPDHIARFLSTLKQHPDAEVIGWDVEIVSPNGRKTRVRPFETDNTQYHNLFHGTMATQRYAARTELFRRAGGWDEQVGLWDDIELGARILSLNPVVVKAQGNPTVRVYEREESVTGTAATSLRRMQPALERMARTLGPSRKHWTPLKAAIQCAVAYESAPAEASAELESTLQSVSPAWRRALYKAAYNYTRRGGRGIARILRPLM